MRTIFSLFLIFICAVHSYAADSVSVIYSIRIDQDIDKSALKRVVWGIDKAEKADADYIVIDLDTYGGAVDAADSIRSAILECDRPVIAFVNMQAASAGALISIACDSIYMKTGSSIGAATVVDQNGNVMPDKYQSFMRGMMRSTAQATGRDPQIAESMVNAENVLSLTPSEAIEVGYCNAVADDIDEVAEYITGGSDYLIKNLDDEMSLSEKIINFFLNPILQSIFLMMIIGGVFIEIRTPGIGLPLGIAILGALLYFAPAYMGHLVSYWEIILFVIGFILIGLEIFVIPGFGICGISGIIALVISLAFAVVDNAELREFDGSLNLYPAIRQASIVIISSSISVFASILLLKRFSKTNSFDHIALVQEMKSSEGFSGVISGLELLIGDEVTVFSDMKPSGKVQTSDGHIYEATLKFGGFASKGEVLKVVSAEQGRLYCDK